MSIYNIYHPRANLISNQIRGQKTFGPHYRYEKAVNNKHDNFDALDVLNLNYRVDTVYGGDYGRYFDTLSDHPTSREGQLLAYIVGKQW